MFRDKSDESQEHLELCGGSGFVRVRLNLSDCREGCWRRLTVRMAAMTLGKIYQPVLYSVHFLML